MRAVELAVDGRLEQIDQIRLQAQHHRLGFRVAEAHVEFDHLRRAMRVDHQPGIQKTGERHAIGDHALHGRLDHFAHHPRMHLGRDHRRR